MPSEEFVQYVGRNSEVGGTKLIEGRFEIRDKSRIGGIKEDGSCSRGAYLTGDSGLTAFIFINQQQVGTDLASQRDRGAFPKVEFRNGFQGCRSANREPDGGCPHKGQNDRRTLGAGEFDRNLAWNRDASKERGQNIYMPDFQESDEGGSVSDNDHSCGAVRSFSSVWASVR